MLTLTQFKNATDFKEVFGTKEIRRNKVLLSVLKHLLKTSRGTEKSNMQWTLLRNIDAERINNANRMIELIENIGFRYWRQDKISQMSYRINGLNLYLYSNVYNIDGYAGNCEDGDINAVRYVNREDGKVYKMKIGKFLRKVLQEIELDKLLGDAFLNYAVEIMTERIKSEKPQPKKFYLKVDDDFSFIYNECNHEGDFGSCMNGNLYEADDFYNNSVSAKAASIICEEEGLILSRCIIYTHVHNRNNDKVIRLAERQYGIDKASNMNLVKALIEAGEIDGYKSFDAGCSDSQAFLNINGEPLEDKEDLYIYNNVGGGDSIMYQDSFKFLIDGKAYNSTNGLGNYKSLSTTDTVLEGDNYDEYNGEFTNDDVVTVNIWRNYRGYEALTVAESYAEYNFHLYEGEYYDELAYSEIMDCDIPHDRIEELEQEYKEQNWFFCEILGDYTEETTILNTYENGIFGRVEASYNLKYEEGYIYCDTSDELFTEEAYNNLTLTLNF